jgi:hypothetical protein
MAVQLKNQIETDLGVVVPMIQFLDGPSVERLAATVLSGIDLSPSRQDAAKTAGEETWEAGSL